MNLDLPLLLLEPRTPATVRHIPFLLHLRIRLGMATECERVEYLNSRWQGRNPSTLSALTMRGLKGLVPVGLGSLAILLTLGACPARQEAPAPSPRPMAPVVVRSYHLDVHVGERRLEEDWQEAAGGTPEESLSRHLDLLAERLASK